MVRLGIRRPGELRSALFLVGLIVVLVFQLSAGIRLIGDHGAYETISILVVVCFVIGISRSWELIGGPSIGLGHELVVFSRAHAGRPADASAVDRDGATDAGGSPDSGGSTEPESSTGETPSGEAAVPRSER
jgi:hypothetical protein